MSYKPNTAKEKSTFRFLLCCIFCLVVSKVYIIQNISVHWDEYLYMSLIYDYWQGRLTSPLQNAHTVLFGWVSLFDKSANWSEIFILRYTVLILHVITLFCIYKSSLYLFPKTVAAFNVLLYLSLNETIFHATSFRTDTIAIPILMGALTLALSLNTNSGKENTSTLLAIGMLIGLAGSITIKSIFLAIPIGIILILNTDKKIKNALISKQVLLPPLTAIIVFTLITAFIAAGTIETSNTQTRSFIQSVNLFLGFSPTKAIDLSLLQLTKNPIFTVILVLSICLLGVKIQTDKQHKNIKTILLTLLLPLLTLIIYRNTYNYFIVFMAAPLSIVCGVFCTYITTKFNQYLQYETVTFLTMLIVLLHSQTLWSVLPQHKIILDNQEYITNDVHSIFETPQNYMAHTGIIPSFPRANFFMSSAGNNLYQKNEVKDFRDTIIDSEPKFIIGTYALSLEQFKNKEDIFHFPLKEHDYDYITQNYIPYWKHIYIAGKEISFETLNEQSVNIIITGQYTIKSDTPIFINNIEYRNNDTVYLNRETYQIKTKHNNAASAFLVWGNKLYQPRGKPNEEPLDLFLHY